MNVNLINYQKNEKFDDLYTPEYAIYPLLKYLPKESIIWECCDNGNSKITEVLRQFGYKVITSGIKEDFLQYTPSEDFDIIITNPPYSQKNKFIKRCYELNKPFALLLPITSLEGKYRGSLFRDYGISVLVFDSRISYTKKNKNWFNTSWFCWNILPEDLIFHKLEVNYD